MKKACTLALIVLFSIQAPLAQAPVFRKVKMIVPTGDKSKAVKVSLWFSDDAVVIRSGQGDKTFPYSEIKAGTYSFSKHPRWKAGAGVAVAVGIFAIPLFFMKSKKHWLTIQAEDDFAVLKLHKNSYSMILAAFESKTGIKVEHVGKR